MHLPCFAAFCILDKCSSVNAPALPGTEGLCLASVLPVAAHCMLDECEERYRFSYSPGQKALSPCTCPIRSRKLSCWAGNASSIAFSSFPRASAPGKLFGPVTLSVSKPWLGYYYLSEWGPLTPLAPTYLAVFKSPLLGDPIYLMYLHMIFSKYLCARCVLKTLCSQN